MPKHSNKLSICAIIVSFNPDANVLTSLLRQIGTQCEFLLIDNASGNLENFRSLAEARPAAWACTRWTPTSGWPVR